VMYELGYAHKAISPDRFLNVMNSHYGTGESLPFDLRHRRWPFSYDLPPGATKSKIRKVKEKLRDFFISHIPEYTDSVSVKAPGHVKIPATKNGAIYWENPSELIGLEDSQLVEGEAYDGDRTLAYVRLWPLQELEKLKPADMHNAAKIGVDPLFGGSKQHLANQFGRLFYNTSIRANGLRSTAQVFWNREVWALCSWIFEEKDLDCPYLPFQAFANELYEAVERYIKVTRDKLGYIDGAYVEVGIVNARGVLVPGGANRLESGVFNSDPFYVGKISFEGLTRKQSEISELAQFQIDAMNEILGAAGMIYRS